MPAILLDIGHHFVEPNLGGQQVHLEVSSTAPAEDPLVTGMDLRVEIADAAKLATKPIFLDVSFANTIWRGVSDGQNAGPLVGEPSIAEGHVSTETATEANGRLVTLTIDTTGIFGGSYPLTATGTGIGATELLADGQTVDVAITNGTLQVKSVWQNSSDPLDIDGDGQHSPRDVLFLINKINKDGMGELDPPSEGNEPPPYVDVNGDGQLSAIDVLQLINCINFGDCPEEIEEIAATPAPVDEPVDDSSGDDDETQDNGSGSDAPGPADPNPPPADVIQEDPFVDTSEGEAVDLALDDLLSEGDANPFWDSIFDA